MSVIRRDEWTTMQAALAFGGFIDAAETERVTVWAAEEIETLRQQLRGAVEVTDEKVQRAAKALAGRYGEEVGWADWQGVARTALEAAGGQ